MTSPSTVTSSIHRQSIHQPETSISRFAVDVQPRMPLRQHGNGKFLWHFENGMPVPCQLLPTSTPNNLLPSTSISTILSISRSKTDLPRLKFRANPFKIHLFYDRPFFFFVCFWGDSPRWKVETIKERPLSRWNSLFAVVWLAYLCFSYIPSPLPSNTVFI